MMDRTILIAEPDHNLVDALRDCLDKEGYQVVSAVDSGQALEAARQSRPDLIVLGITFPTMSGLEVCRVLRSEMMTPVLMLAANAEDVVGLGVEADDCLTKPFSMEEFVARVQVMLRRAEMVAQAPPDESPLISLDNLKINEANRQVTIDDIPLDLTPKEFDLLAYLSRNYGLVFSRQHLLEKVWGYDFAGTTRTVDVHIRWLRKKIETNPANPKRIITIRNIGYKLER
jgi:two-component system OmpR family response regulator